jgi:hypothetical protein
MCNKTLIHNMDVVGCSLELFAASTMTPGRHSTLALPLFPKQPCTMPSATQFELFAASTMTPGRHSALALPLFSQTALHHAICNSIMIGSDAHPQISKVQ